MKNLHTIILAAGESRRYGAPKQLVSWNGETLLHHTIARARKICNANVMVVLGAHAEIIRATLQDGRVNVVLNYNWREGMASSIRTGITALPDEADAALFLLCDQPMVGDLTLSMLLDRWRQFPASIVAGRYNNTNGVPAIFPRSMFTALLNLKGDLGAKQIIQSHPDQLETVPVPEAGFDINTRDDLKTLLAEHEIIRSSL